MRTLRRLRLLTAVSAVPVAVVASAGPLAHPAAAVAAPTVAVTSLHFKVSYPSGGQTRQCDVVGDLYVPSDASASHPLPAILTTSGFGGSKADQAYVGTALGAHHYVTLSYSGLGFGGSGCPITDDDPTSDGVVASQLVSFLGGQGGIAYTGFDALNGWSGAVAPLDVVARDNCDHSVTPICGSANPNDPRVGMVGGSYGGEIQLAAASVDPRIDTVVPLITWNELSYSLQPGNAATTPAPLAAGLPGVAKKEWDSFFFSLGVAASAGGGTSGSPRSQSAGEPQPGSAMAFGATDAMCPGFAPETCVAQATTEMNGFDDPTAQAFFSHSSVASYIDKIHIPVFLGQGQADSLFNLQEAATTYTALQARAVPVKMMWQSWGHSRVGPAPGEFYNALTAGSDPTTLDQTYQGQVIQQWFDHYLAGTAPVPALDFSWFRDWAYTPSGTNGAANEPAAAAAYASAPSFPVGTRQRYSLSGTSALVPEGAPVTTGMASLAATPGGVGSYSETSVVGATSSYASPFVQPPPSDPTGTFAAWTGPVLGSDTDVVGMPTLDVTVASGEAQTADPTTHLVLFAKLYDLAPDGTTVVLPERLVSPVRVTGLGAAGSTTTVHITLPGIVHRFAAGHSFRVVLASSDTAYSGNNTARTAVFPTSASAPGVLAIPVVPNAGPPALVPEAPATVALPAVGGVLVVLAAAAGVRRRRTRRP